MTPQERAAYLIKELGLDKATLHVAWVLQGTLKPVTKEYWESVSDCLKTKEAY